jgi:Anti-sigma factor NepR
LSVNSKDGSFRGAGKAMQKKSPDDKKNRKQRAGDIGRALRTIYDDTLRESVPDDFSDLLGKLS